MQILIVVSIAVVLFLLISYILAERNERYNEKVAREKEQDEIDRKLCYQIGDDEIIIHLLVEDFEDAIYTSSTKCPISRKLKELFDVLLITVGTFEVSFHLSYEKRIDYTIENRYTGEDFETDKKFIASSKYLSDESIVRKITLTKQNHL